KGDTDFLAAYFTADRQIEIRKLRDHLASSLTAYMVPQAFMQLEEMPLTPNGKVDRKALPKLTIEADEIVPPENETQEAILKDASEVIGGVQLGITTDLYAAGMSSIGCIRLCALLSERFNRSIKVAEIFEHRTVKDIESLISEKEEDAGYELLEEYPLSMTQQGIYIECEKYKGTTIYNLPELYELDPAVDTARLAEAVTKVIKAHPYLMMQPVKAAEGELHAKRRDDLGFEVKRVKCAHLPGEDELVRPFDLELEEPLFRAEIYETDEGNYFFFDTHHIVSDGGSIDILIRDIERAYQGEEVPKETYTAYEFALDEQKARSSDRFTKARAFYDGIFEGCGGETVPVKDGSEGAGHSAFKHVTGAGIAAQVQRFCEDNSLSLNAFYTAVFGLALKSYTGSEQAVFSAIYNGRNDVRLADSVSMLVKTLPVYLACDPDESVKSYIEGCQRFLLSAMANDIYSFAEIRSAYDIRADVLFAFQGEYEHEVKLGGRPAKAGMLSLSQTRSELGIDVFTDGDHIVYEVEYDPSSYSEYTVDGILRMMDRIACEFTGKGMLEDVTLISEDEAAAIDGLYDSSFPVRERPAYRLLQDSAVKYPDKKAVVATDRTLTYRELNEEANAIGHVLMENGAGPESIVAVMAERNSYAYVMRQGVLKSGGAFLPIDPEYPEDRIRFILEDSGAKILVTTAKTAGDRADLLNDLSAGGLRVIRAEEAVAEGSREDPDAEVPYEALAYVIYTSGSTGRPKGVMLTNKNLVNFVDDDEKNREIQGYTRRGHVSLAIAALTFDFSIMEEFVPIANGLTVVLATQEEIMNPEMLSAVMKENDVDIMSCTPSYLLNMLDMSECTDVFTDAVKNLRSVDVGAEAFPPALYDKLKAVNPDIYIMNGYGPTETTIGCTMQVIENGNDITIGVPSVNVSVATIDREGRLQPLGALGEMVIIGDGVGRGYIGRDDLTKKSFISLFGKKAYRSGDLVRIREDRNIEFHGRIDNQVKLRGLRVELGEIESVINSYPGVSSCIVIVVKQETEYLAAYFTAKEETDINSLKEHISAKLTAYMVPQVFMQLESMPLTANGKIDKKKLPKPVAKQEEIAPPENDIQREILEELEKVLGKKMIGITTDLFEAGLSSIGSIKLCTLLSQRFDRTIRVSDLFERKTVKDIEQFISGGAEEQTYEVRKEYPLTMSQMGIFLESIRYMGSTVYNIPYLYRLDASVDMEKLKTALQEVFAAHPGLFMTMKSEDNKAVAVRNDVRTIGIEIQKEMPDRDELVRPFDLLSGQELYRVGLYDTAEGKYLFIDLHHIISDGESFNILFEDLDAAYNGQKLQAEEYTGFDAALVEEAERASDKFTQAKEWYDRIFRGTEGVVLPEREEILSGENEGLYTRISGIGAKEVRKYCEEKELSLNAFFTALFGVSLKAYTGSEDAVFTTIYNGRSDPRTERCISMFVKTLPILLKPYPEQRISEYIGNCGKYLINAMANDIVSFAEISREYGIESDILFAYQGEAEENESVKIGSGPAEEIELSLSQAKAPFGLDIYIDGDSIKYEFEYDPEMYTTHTMDRFTSMMDAVLGRFLAADKLLDVYDCDAVRELSGERKKTEKAAAENGGTAGEEPAAGALVEELRGIFKKVLGLDNVNDNDNFFEIGGTSLTAAQVMMAAMSQDLPVLYKDVFEHPTISALASLVEEKHKAIFGTGA
ncbi:MAG: amino acid adenylation domain-containing protein, partial [Lachnospiraceae bacterium]|nr:amino acid adenylation domain-containing protein [Lachnospiraceae bacterium]